jgi:predicted metal-dependent enzyme (double-stranded beta helix superfamily)
MRETMVRAQLSVSDWVQGLAGIPAREFTPANVERYIVQNAIVGSSLEPYIYFSVERYTRNLIFKNDVFECMAVCWDIGQSSPIHDHNDKLGWIYLAEGRLLLQNYLVKEKDSVRGTCRLEPTDAVELSSENAGHVDREQEVHKVCNLPKFKQRAVSVHIYEQPMTECEIYSLAGTVAKVKLSYTSEYGQLKDGAVGVGRR